MAWCALADDACLRRYRWLFRVSRNSAATRRYRWLLLFSRALTICVGMQIVVFRLRRVWHGGMSTTRYGVGVRAGGWYVAPILRHIERHIAPQRLELSVVTATARFRWLLACRAKLRFARHTSCHGCRRLKRRMASRRRRSMATLTVAKDAFYLVAPAWLDKGERDKAVALAKELGHWAFALWHWALPPPSPLVSLGPWPPTCIWKKGVYRDR